MSSKNLAVYVHYATGEERLKAQLSDAPKEKAKSDMRYIAVVSGTVCELVGAEKPEDVGVIDVSEVGAAIKAKLESKGLSGGYVRNVLMYYRRIVAASDPGDVPARARASWQHHLAWVPESVCAALPGWKVTARYLDQFFTMDGVPTLKSRDGDALVRAFAAFLESRHGLLKDGGVRRHRKNFKAVLQQMDFRFYAAEERAPLPAKMESDLEKIRDLCIGKDQRKTARGKRALFDEDKRFEAVGENTWKRTEGNLRSYLSCLMKGKKRVSEILVDYLTEECLKNWLQNEAYDREKYTTASANTYIDSLTRVIRSAGFLKIGGFERWSDKEIDELRSSFWKHYFYTTEKLEKPGVNERLRSSGSLPSYSEIYRIFYKNFQEKSGEYQGAMKKWASLNQRDKQSLLLRTRDLFMACIVITFAPRPKDLFETIQASDLERFEDIYLLSYLPSKTSRHKDAPLVHACLPPWFTDFAEFYLKSVRPKINGTSSLLFPGMMGSGVGTLRGNRFEKIRRLTRRYFNREVGPNWMRKILTSAFSEFEISGLNRFLGHKEDRYARRLLTKVERENYLIEESSRIVRQDRKMYVRLNEAILSAT